MWEGEPTAAPTALRNSFASPLARLGETEEVRFFHSFRSPAATSRLASIPVLLEQAAFVDAGPFLSTQSNVPG